MESDLVALYKAREAVAQLRSVEAAIQEAIYARITPEIANAVAGIRRHMILSRQSAIEADKLQLGALQDATELNATAGRATSVYAELTGAVERTRIALSESVAFNQQAQDLMMNAPSEVTPKQLKELHIRIVD